ncbi:rhodopsin, GQ-coupled-like [Haliotis asinina]|uniref:rhodopsin, GQ-coupled-like n=1 Tax=Haliotis asinina TaxID=109174 RepID=UPI003531AEC9
MDHDNETIVLTDAVKAATAINGVVNAWCILGNIVNIVIISKTPGMRGFSGALIINHAAAEILQECVTQCIIFLYVVRPRIVQLDICLRLCILALSGVISHSLSAVSVNLYLAIFKLQRYSRIVTWKRVFAFLGWSWNFNIALSSLYYFVPSFYTVDYNASTDIVFTNITQSNCWFLVLILINVFGIPFCTATTCFLKIRSAVKRPTIATIGPNNAKKVQLSQVIHIFTMIYLLTYVPFVIVSLVNVKMEGIKAVLWTVHTSYHVTKLFLYFKVY